MIQESATWDWQQIHPMLSASMRIVIYRQLLELKTTIAGKKRAYYS